MTYDPRQFGALCDVCPMTVHRVGGPVPPEFNGTLALVVGEAPGKTEVEKGSPFVGESGIELQDALRGVGVRRKEISLSNAILCRPPENQLELLLHKFKKEGLSSPIDCCRPRLLTEMAHFGNIVTLGGKALRAVTNHDASILNVRGGPVELKLDKVNPDPVTWKLLPTVHPAFVRRARRWRIPFRADIGRAFRWFKNGLRWIPPKETYVPSYEQIERFLVRDIHPTVLDLETDGIEPLICNIRCVGLGRADEFMIVPLLSIDGVTKFYPTWEEDRIVRLLVAWITSPRIKTGHNIGGYDKPVMKARWGATVKPIVDTLILHRLSMSELPHGLGYCGSTMTDAPAWKADHTATTAKSDDELWKYCGLDCSINAMIEPQLRVQVIERQQAPLVAIDHKIQEVAVGMHENGMFVDQAVRRKFDEKLRQQAQLALSECRMHSKRKDLNPGSVFQLRDIIFDDWGLTPLHYSVKTGDPSLDDETVRVFMTKYGLDASKTAFLKALRSYRKAVKLRGAYIVPLRPLKNDQGPPSDSLWWNDEVEEEDRKRALVLADGRFHSTYNSTGTTSGRYSSSSPNAQNFPLWLREMVVAPPGRTLVGADEGQIELRVVADLAGCESYMEVFEAGGDPHDVTCHMLFGDQYSLCEDKVLKKRMRFFAKQVSYSSIYGAEDETVHDIIVSAEDDDGNLINPNLSLRETAAMHRKWLDANPEIEKWWVDVVEEWRSQKFLAEPVFGRRRDFLDGEDRNEMLNFKPQSAASAVVHLCEFDLLDEIPFQKWGAGTGLIAQVHDSLVVEVPENEAESTRLRLEAIMTRKVRGLSVPFVAEAATGHNWKEV